MQHINTKLLHIRQGSHETSLKRNGQLSADITVSLPIGRVLHLDPTQQKFKTGMTDEVLLPEPPFMIDRGTQTEDVSIDAGDPESDAEAWLLPNIDPVTVNTIGLLGDYEIETTEFEPEATAGTYALNDALTAIPADTNATTGGRITKGAFGTKPTLGFVSRVVAAVEPGGTRNMLGFYTYYFPRLS